MEEKDKKIIEESLGKIPIMDPNAKRYNKFLFIPIIFYIVYIIFTLIILIKNGTLERPCMYDAPICFLGTTSIYYEPLLCIILFGLIILLLLNIANLLYEPMIYLTFIPEAVMLLFIAFINIKLVLLFIVIIIPKIVYLYEDNKNKEIVIEKI